MLVLVLISVSLALSYAVLRWQGTAVQIEGNSGLGLSARQAALSGVAVGLKKMHESTWSGVDTTLAGYLGPNCRFEVRFTTGDPSLAPSRPDYAEYPYRVTLTSTGYAEDPADPQRKASYRVRAVARLVPRKLADAPSPWPAITSNTLYQYKKDGTVTLAVPCRIRGPIRSYGKWAFPAEYAWSSTVQTQYFKDLNQMRLAGQPDCRPFDSTIALRYAKQNDTDLISLLNKTLDIPTADLTDEGPTDWVHPGEVKSYRIYPGGKVYQVPSLSQSLWYSTWEPDPINNPLGIYYRCGGLDLYDNVTIRGTVVLKGSNADLHLFGRNIRLQAVDLPPVYPGSQPVQLPLVVAQDDIHIVNARGGEIMGLLAAWDRFEIGPDGQEDFNLAMNCRIVCRNMTIHGRTEWLPPLRWSSWWTAQLTAFQAQRESGIPYFPDWLKSAARLDYVPRIVIQPESRAVTYHYPWKNPAEAIYVPHPDDGGLRWELVDWVDNPPSN